MPQPPLTDAQCQEAIDAYYAHGCVLVHAADALKMARSTFENRLNAAK
jgi:hypothetical protein